MSNVGQIVIPLNQEGHITGNSVFQSFNPASVGIYERETSIDNGINGNFVFQDTAIPLNENPSQSEMYYLTVDILNDGVQNEDGDEIEAFMDKDEDITILLVNPDYMEKGTAPYYQTLKRINATYQKDKVSSFEFIFVPNQNEYSHLIFMINRVSADFLCSDRKVKITDLKIERLHNHFNEINNSFDPSTPQAIKRVGIQAAPGTLFSLGGEDLMIGRRGIYEITEDMNLSQLGIARTSRNPLLGNSILVDYKIDKEEDN